MTKFKYLLDERVDGSITLVQIDLQTGVADEWCTVGDINTLFDTCSARWGTNWDLNKVCVAIRESDID